MVPNLYVSPFTHNARGAIFQAVMFDAGDTASPDPVERVSSRPDLCVLCYPVITMGEHAHAGSRHM